MQPLIVTAAIIRQRGKVLITRRPVDKPHGGLWELPGGKLHDGESPPEALQRELREELGIDVMVEDIFEVVYHRYEQGAVLILAYLCRWLDGELQHLEVDDHRWIFPRESALYPMLAADQPIFERLARPATPAGDIPAPLPVD
jgi:8-oxo-dGTP diphosphatase